MELIEKIQLLDLRVKKAVHLIELLRREKAELQRDYELVKTANEELSEYAEKYKDNTELITQSVDQALTSLDGIDGLDDLDLTQLTTNELEAAEDFTAGGALGESEAIDDLDSIDLSDF